MKFPFEDTPVYRLSQQWNEAVMHLGEKHPERSLIGLFDQLRRAALSISLNFAEGYGRWPRGDKRQFFRIARGSVFECVPILQLLKARALVNDEEYESHYQRLQELAKMLTGLIGALETPAIPIEIR